MGVEILDNGTRVLTAPGAAVIATGTLPASIRSACTADIDYRATLVLDGLFTIWTKNTRR